MILLIRRVHCQSYFIGLITQINGLAKVQWHALKKLTASCTMLNYSEMLVIIGVS